MRIYVASSWKNLYQPELVKALRSVGHSVYDFRAPTSRSFGFHWSEVEKKPRPWDVETTRRALAHPIAEKGHALDFQAMQQADACVLVLPAGRSASFELGFMMGGGAHGIVLQLGEEEPELMFRDATIVGSFAELLRLLACQNCGLELPGEVCPPGYCSTDCLERAATR